MPNPVAGFLHHDHCALLEITGGSFQNGTQPLDDVGRPRVSQAKEDYADGPPARQSHALSEIEVERDDDPRLGHRALEDLPVREAMEPELAEMHNVVTLRAQPFGDAKGHAHVGQEAQRPSAFRRCVLLPG